jgi:5-methylcytosine-specific restriction protein A
VRQITVADHQILLAAARDLALEPRARILPEERLEAALLLGNAGTVRELIREESPGLAEQRREYLYTRAPARSRDLARQLQELYAGRCQLCEWDPRLAYGVPLCHAHHIQWLSRGGEDQLGNLVLVCPNHHAAIHRRDAPLDYADLAFDFVDRREPLRLNDHLRPDT